MGLRTRNEAVPGSPQNPPAPGKQAGQVNHLHVAEPLLAEHKPKVASPTSDAGQVTAGQRKRLCRQSLRGAEHEPAHCHKKSVPVWQEAGRFGKTRKEWLMSVGQQ